MGEPDKRRILYDAVSKDYELGTYEEFSAKLDNPTKRKAFYDVVSSEYQLGSYEEFESKILKKKDNFQFTSGKDYPYYGMQSKESTTLGSEFIPSNSRIPTKIDPEEYNKKREKEQEIALKTVEAKSILSSQLSKGRKYEDIEKELIKTYPPLAVLNAKNEIDKDTHKAEVAKLYEDVTPIVNETVSKYSQQLLNRNNYINAVKELYKRAIDRGEELPAESDQLILSNMDRKRNEGTYIGQLYNAIQDKSKSFRDYFQETLKDKKYDKYTKNQKIQMLEAATDVYFENTVKPESQKAFDTEIAKSGDLKLAEKKAKEREAEIFSVEYKIKDPVNYIVQKSFDNSVLGSAANLATGRLIGADAYGYTPEKWEDVTTGVVSMLWDAPLFSAGGQIGSSVGKGVFNSTKLARLSNANAITKSKLLATGFTEAEANNLITKSTEKILNAYQGYGSGAGAFALYDSANQALNEVKDNDWENATYLTALKSIGNVALKGAEGAITGSVLHGMNVGLRSMDKTIDKYISNKAINLVTKGAKGIASVPVKAGVFTGLTSIYTGETPTSKSFQDNLEFIVGLKLMHGVQNVFTPAKWLPKDSPYRKENVEINGVEYKLGESTKESLVHFNPKLKFEDKETTLIREVLDNPEQLNKYLTDDNVPLVAKAEILNLATGQRVKSLDILPTKYEYTEHNDYISLYNKEGQLVDYYTKGDKKLTDIDDALKTNAIHREIMGFTPKEKASIENEFDNLFNYDELFEAIDLNKSERNDTQRRLVNQYQAKMPKLIQDILDKREKNVSTEEILGTSEPRPTEQVTDKVNDIVKQEKPEPTKVNIFGKEMSTYNNFIPEKEQVESEALYNFTSNSKEGIPEILRDKAKLITKATTKIDGKTVENETWTANITGEELNKLYEKQSKPEVITPTKEEKVAEITKEEPIKPQENDSKDITGLRSVEQKGETTIEEKPEQKASTEKADADTNSDIVKKISDFDLKNTTKQTTPEEVNSALKDVKSTAKALELNNKTTKELDDIYESLSTSSDKNVRTLANMVENVQEKNERTEILNASLDNVSKTVNDILKRDSYFLEKKEAREAKEVAEKYIGEVSKQDAKKDFKDAFFGNPNNWVADALKMRESIRVWVENGGSFKDLLSSVQKEFEGDGFTEQDAASVIKNKLESLTKKDFRQQQLSEAYHKAKKDGSNPELVKAVEDLLGKPSTKTEPSNISKGEDWSRDVESTAKALEKVDMKSIISPMEEGKRIDGFDGGTKIYRSGGTGRYFTTDKRYIQEGRFKNPIREFEIPQNSNLLDLRDADFKGILDLATNEERQLLSKSAAKNSKEAKKQGDIVDAILKRNGYDGYIIKDAGDTKDYDTVVFRKDRSPDYTAKSISEAYHKAKEDGSNPELVKAVEELLSQKKDINATGTKEVTEKTTVPEKLRTGEVVIYKYTDKDFTDKTLYPDKKGTVERYDGNYVWIKTKDGNSIKTKPSLGEYTTLTNILENKSRKIEHKNSSKTDNDILTEHKDLFDSINKTLKENNLSYNDIYITGSFVNKDISNDIDIIITKDNPKDVKGLKFKGDKTDSELYEDVLSDYNYNGLPINVIEVTSKADLNKDAFGRFIKVPKEVSPTQQKETFNNNIENNGKKIKGITVVDVKDDTITYGNNKTVTNIKIKSKEDAESELKFSKEQLDYEEKQLPKLIKGDEKIQNSLGYSLKEKNDSKKGIAEAKKNIEVLKNIVIPFYEKYLKETKSEKPSEGVSPAPVETGLAKSDIVKKYVEEIKTKEDISETKKTEATKKISDGLSEISEIIASKLQAKKGIVEDTDINFRESLKKVAEGVYDLSVLKAEELIDKVKEVFKKTFEGEQLREIIKQINNNSEEIAALYYEKKGEKLKKTELQKQIDKAVGQTTKLNREYSKLKRDMLFLEKGDNATEAEKYNNFLFKVRDIVSEAKNEGEIDYDIADKILSEIEKTTKFKKELTRESKRIEALVKIENLITENVVSTQHEKLTKDIEKQIGQRLQKQGSKQKGYTIEEWDFKNNVDALLKTKTDLNKANTELEQKLSETTNPKEEASLMEKMMIVDYASRVKEYEDLTLNFDKLSLNEKREAITKLTELKEYFKDKTKNFIEKYKEEVQQRAEHKQKLRETSEKGTRRKDYDSKVRLLENVLKNSESKEDILFELISNSDKSVSEKLNKKSQKLLALNDVDFRLELQKILGVKLESKSERDIEDTKSKIFVFHPLKALENLRGLTETVFGIGGKENYKPINEIMDRIDDSPRVMERLDVKMRNMIDNTVDILDKKIKNIRNDKTSKLGISIKGKNGKEAPELYELSYTQVVSIALQMRQDLGYISAVKRYGEEGAMRLQNHVESIIKNTPTLEKYANSVLNFYKENYDVINEVYRRIYKTDMPNIDGYVPLTKISEILETIGMEVGVDGAANKRGTLYVSPSNLNKRKGGGELDISKDAEQVMNNYRKQMSDFVAYAEVKREMIELFTDPQVRANIKSISGGDTYLKYFDLYLNNFPNIQRTDTMVAERLVTGLIRNIVIAPLTLNPKLFFIQAASASNFSAEMVYDAAWKYLPVVNQSLYIKELLKANRWSEYIDQFKDSAFIKHRLQQGFDRDFQAFVNNRFIPTLKSNTNTKKIINELGRIIEKEIKTGAIKSGDIASFLGGMPVYYQQKEILRKENPTMPEDMLRLKAFEKMATLGEKSLQSSYVHLLSPYQLSRVSKLTPYMSNPIQFQQKQFRAIRNLSRGGGSAKEYAQSVNGLLFYTMGTTIIFEAMQAFYNNVILGKQYDDEDENPIQTDEQKKLTGKAIEWIGKGFMQGVPVAGESIEFIGLKLQKKKGFQPEASGTIARANDVLKTTLDITSFLADNYTSKDGFDWDKIPKSKRDKFFKDMRATLEYAGWNTKPTEKIIDRIKDGTAYPITLDIYKQAAINRYVKTGNPDMINDLRSKGIITKQVKKAMLKRALKLKEGIDYTDEELENEIKKENKKELNEEKIKNLKWGDND